VRTTYNIIKKYVDIKEDPYKLAEKLTNNGLEVEKVEEYSFIPSEKFIIGKILEKEKHPNADKLTLCKVDIGSKVLNIVCGAKNHNKGDKVVVALEGARLPNGLEIKKTKIRGVESEGMLCSKAELGLEEKSDGIWILPDSVKIGDKVDKILPEKDYIFHISVTSNRSDCLCSIGIAREAGIIEGKSINYPKYKINENSKIEKPNIIIQNTMSCYRYSSRIIKGVKVGESPDWLKEELIKLGARPINNIVDITNYVMLQLGHPMHAFDYNKLAGSKIVVRSAKKGEKIIALDGKEYELSDDILVIADELKPVAIAGVIGGENSKVDENTIDILLESAYFIPKSVRNSSKKLGIKTDSSYRFERDMDPENTIKALDYATYLIQEIMDCEISEIVDIYPVKVQIPEIELKHSFIKQILGFDIDKTNIERCLELLEIDFKKKDDDFIIKFPSFRRDCYRAIDAVEEIIRVYGYSNIEETIRPVNFNYNSFKSSLPLEYKIREILGNYLYEVYNFSFTSIEEVKKFNLFDEKNIIKIRNPMNSFYSYMRTSLAGGLFNNIINNTDKGNPNLLLFEIGKIFYYDNENIKEVKKLGIIGNGILYKNWMGEEKIDFYTIKGIIDNLLLTFGINSNYVPTDKIKFLHPNKSGLIYYRDILIGFIGEINPYICDDRIKPYYAELDLESIENIINNNKKNVYKEISKYPTVRKDLSFVMNKDMNVSEVIEIIRSNNLVQKVEVIDVYTNPKIGEDKKSVTFSFLIQSYDHTFTDDEINSIMSCIIEKAKNKGVYLRDK